MPPDLSVAARHDCLCSAEDLGGWGFFPKNWCHQDPTELQMGLLKSSFIVVALLPAPATGIG